LIPTVDITVTAAGGVGPYTGTGTFSEGAGTYSYTITDANGCQATTNTVVVDAAPGAPIATATVAGSLTCLIPTVDITVTATGGVGPYTGTGTFSEGAGSYNYTITDANGCSASTTVIVASAPDAPQITIESTTTELNCFTTSIELTAVGDAGTLTWSVDGAGCPGPLNPGLICSDFFDPVCGCDGVTYSNPCYAERDGGVLYYLPGECGSTDGVGSIVVNNPGDYTVSLNANGCVATYTISIEENLEVPSANVTSVSPICSNQNASFTITGTAGDVVTYTTDSGITSQTITIDASGSNTVGVNAPASDVTLELIDVTRGNCYAELDATATVVVVPSPVANATGPAFALCEGLTLALTSQEVTGATYSWTGPGGFTSGNSDVFIPNVSADDGGQYFYSISVGSCTDYDTVVVIIAEPTTAEQNIAICDGQSFTLPSGVVVNAEGTYTSNLFNSLGCDSTVTTNLTIVDEFIVEIDVAICEGQSYLLPDGTPESDSGEYVFELQSSGGCDSTVTVNLTVNQTYYSLQTISICEGESYTLADGTQVSTSDLYEVSFNSQAGCDSIVAVQLNVLPVPLPAEFVIDLCVGETATLADGTVVNTAGSYPVILQAENGCDSLQIYTVNFWPNYSDTIQVVICHNEAYQLPNGQVVSDGGNYLVVDEQSANGCDSTLVISVIELNPITQTLTVPLCFNQAYTMPDGSSIGEDGIYDFILTSATGCDSLVSIQLEVAEQIYGDPEQVLLCFGETHTLPNGDVVSTNGEYTSVLSTDAGCDSLIVSSIVALDYIFTDVAAFACQGETYTLPSGQNVSMSGVYQSILTNEVGCDSTVQVTVTFSNPVIVSIIPEVDSLTVCAGDTLLLIADGASTFNWETLNPLSDYDDAIIEAYPTTDGYISVEGSNLGCEGRDSVYVTVNPLPEMQIVAPDAICFGDSVTVVASGADSLLWMNDDVLLCPTCPENVVSPSESTVFMVGGWNGSCYGTTSFVMEVQSLPVASVFGDTLVCAFSPAELYAAGGESYLWNNGATTSSIMVEPGETTVYQVVAISGICADTTTITVEAIPLPQIVTNNDTTITLGGEVQLFATGGVNYSWSPADDLSCTVCPNPLAIPSESVTYCVQALSEFGCTDTSCLRIEVTGECETFFIPNAFAPERGGHEMNDCFRPFGEECFASMRMRVFDRWGELVFESTSFEECWDGNYQGKKVNSGVFVYYFDGVLINGDPFYRKGNVTVIR
jgi:gliding motility-associated-like protein